MLRIFILTLVCCILIQEGVAVECFACTSLTSDGSSCGDPFSGDPSITPKCSLSPDLDGVCIKQQVMSTGGAIKVTTRMCQTRSTNYCEHLKDTIEATGAGTVEHCSYCDDHDLCNAGPKSAVVSLSALVLVAAAALRHFIFA